MSEIHEIPEVQVNYPNLFDEKGKINLESEEATDLLNDFQEPKAFDKVGYARSLGGFFYQFFYAIIGAGVLALTYSTILGVLYPFPESKSYVSMAGILFLVIQNFFNIPTGFAIERFIGEWRIKDPRRMIQYIRFYIWYQMLTGIVLVTAFSVYTLSVLGTESGLEWAKWLMLITISREYPANTGVFLSSLKGMQKFDYESKLNFVNDTFIRPGFEVLFVLWGKYVLGANPVIGTILGIAIGYALGTYVDDFLSMALAMIYFNKAIKPMGYSLIDCFYPQVDRDVIWTSLRFGFIVAIPGLIGSFFTTITTLWWYAAVPAYLTFIALSNLADEIANIMKKGGGINVKATISEAYNNDKKELTSYYISLSWKFIFFFMFAIGAVVFSFIPLLLEVLLVAGGAENYILAAAFIVPNILATSIEQPVANGQNILLGSNKPTYVTIVDVSCHLINLAILYVMLFIVDIPGTFGIIGIVWLIPMAPVPTNIIKLFAYWIYINKKVAPVRFNKFAWQSFLAPVIPAIIVFVIAQGWKAWVFPALVTLLGGTNLALIIAGTISILFAFIVCIMMIFFPLYTAVGGWDKNTMAIFHEAVEISGPSKFLFRPIYKASNWLGKKSPLHNKFPIPYEKAQHEALELMQERFIKDKLVAIYAKTI